MTQRVLVTGANGFIGRRLTSRLAGQGMLLRAASRQWLHRPQLPTEPVIVGDLSSDVDWTHALRGVSTVVHLASRVHVLRELAPDPLAAFRLINVEGTLNLARQSVMMNVKRFIFLSSLKVNGETGRFSESDVPNPQDPYAISKYEAELGLLEIARRTGLDVVVIRPPLVYGPGVRGNFKALMRMVDLGIPLPLRSITNRRSFVAVDNLVDLIVTCIEHSTAANETFFVSDGEDLSTPDLVRRLAITMNRSVPLFPVPAQVLLICARLVNKREIADRLLRSLQVDVRKARELLGWVPRISVEEGLRRTVCG